MKNTDLHIHTYYSDGLYALKKIISLAKSKGLKNISITDHDSIKALDNIPSNLKDLNIINGVEIQADSSEILGYFFDKDNESLNSLLYKNKKAKEEHTKKTLEKMQDLNIDIDITEIQDIAKDVLMKTHIARLMVKKKYCKTIQEAYDKYLKNIKVRTNAGLRSAKKTIKTIKKANGVAVLPHPWFLKKNKSQLFNYVQKLKRWGLEGIETTGYIPLELRKKKNTLENICDQLDLIKCGGSDFHGLDLFSENKLGKFNIDNKIIKKLKNRIK